MTYAHKKAGASRALHVALFGALLSCADNSVSTPPLATSLQLITPTTRIEVGEAVTIAAFARDARDSLVSSAVIWSTSPGAVATVVNGVVAGVAPGTALVEATVQSASAALAVDVVPASAARLTLAATTSTLAPGATSVITAEVRDRRGAVLPGRVVTWSSTDARVLHVSASGLATAVGPGTAHVVARSDDVRDSVALTVTNDANATLVITPTDLVVALGRTRSFTTRVRDASGVLSVPDAVTWTSENPQVASVSNGVVTGVAEGTTVIRAQRANMTAVANVLVSAGVEAFTVGTTTITHRLIRADTIHVSGTLTATGPLTLIASGDIVVTGAINTPCQPLTLLAGGRVILSRRAIVAEPSLDNSCAAESSPIAAPMLRVEADGGYALTFARVRSSGDITFTNDAGLLATDFVGAPIARANQHCLMSSVTIEHGAVANATDGGSGRDGANIDIACRGTFRTSATNIHARGGTTGGNRTHAASAVGGDGGHSGRIRFRVTGDVIVDTRRLFFRVFGAGNGGDATSTAEGVDGASAHAVGGRAGDVGAPGLPPIEFRVAGSVIDNDPTTLNVIEMGIFNGGRGGHAVASGADGRAATAVQPAGAGGSATAIAGRGGRVYASVIAVVGALPESALWLLGQNAGDGGSATATGGRGGGGSPEFPHGAPGGRLVAEGGDGGTTTGVNSAVGSPARGGNAGAATFSGGIGGPGVDRCAVPGVGGRGGSGGSAFGFDGRPATGQSNGALGGVVIRSAANGGDGGRGSTAGVGGRAGVDSIQARGARAVTPPAFTNGAAGSACP